jgi:NADH-quinone oxidoreductase subunit A
MEQAFYSVLSAFAITSFTKKYAAYPPLLFGGILHKNHFVFPDKTGYNFEHMDQAVAHYFPIVIFLGIAVVLAMLMVLLPMAIGRQKPDNEKTSAYECGFEAFSDARGKFDVRFYLVAILFIIFDLEVAFLFPWAVSLGVIGKAGFWSMVGFLGVLTVGFIYEWMKGALEWE